MAAARESQKLSLVELFPEELLREVAKHVRTHDIPVNRLVCRVFDKIFRERMYTTVTLRMDNQPSPSILKQFELLAAEDGPGGLVKTLNILHLEEDRIVSFVRSGAEESGPVTGFQACRPFLTSTLLAFQNLAHVRLVSLQDDMQPHLSSLLQTAPLVSLFISFKSSFRVTMHESWPQNWSSSTLTHLKFVQTDDGPYVSADPHFEEDIPLGGYLLSRCPNLTDVELKHLEFRITPRSFPFFEVLKPFHPRQFPHLKSFTLKGNWEFPFNEIPAVSWQNLECLHLGRAFPFATDPRFWSMLTGIGVHLTKIHVASICEAFLEHLGSYTGLEDVEVNLSRTKVMPEGSFLSSEFFRVLQVRHSTTLRKLVVELPRQKEASVWCLNDFCVRTTLLDLAMLEHLSISLHVPYGDEEHDDRWRSLEPEVSSCVERFISSAITSLPHLSALLIPLHPRPLQSSKGCSSCGYDSFKDWREDAYDRFITSFKCSRTSDRPPRKMRFGANWLMYLLTTETFQGERFFCFREGSQGELDEEADSGDDFMAYYM